MQTWRLKGRRVQHTKKVKIDISEPMNHDTPYKKALHLGGNAVDDK